MPWCPVCKNEYREGIKVCTDCGTALVDELTEEKIMAYAAYMEDESQAKKFTEYLEYSNIECDIEVMKDGSFGIVVNEADETKAKNAYKAFIKSETEQFEEALSQATDVEKEAYKKALKASAEQYKPAGVYVSQSETAKDMKATATTFLVFAVLLAILAPLFYFGIIPVFEGNLIANVFLGCMAVGCLLVGVSSIKRAKTAQANSSEEEKNTKTIQIWLKDNADYICNNDYNPIDKTLPEELLYLERSDRLKAALEKEFGKLDSAYVETLIDEFYDEHFGA